MNTKNRIWWPKRNSGELGYNDSKMLAQKLVWLWETLCYSFHQRERQSCHCVHESELCYCSELILKEVFIYLGVIIVIVLVLRAAYSKYDRKKQDVLSESGASLTPPGWEMVACLTSSLWVSFLNPCNTDKTASLLRQFIHLLIKNVYILTIWSVLTRQLWWFKWNKCTYMAMF